MSVVFRIELERETDGRWIAEVVELPGVLTDGASQDDAIARVQALALRVVADRLENEEAGRENLSISFAAAGAMGRAAAPTSSSLSTTGRRSARACSPGSPGTAAGTPRAHEGCAPKRTSARAGDARVGASVVQ
jgi:predicted RNase H-like HicB family nuclease